MSDHTTQEKIMSDTHKAIQSLEKLRQQQESLLSSEDEVEDAKLDLISRNIEMIDLGLAEGNVMFSLVQHMDWVEAQVKSLKNLAKKLDKENTWLTDVLYDVRENLFSSERAISQLKKEKEELESKNKSLETELGQLKSSEVEGKQLTVHVSPVEDTVLDHLRTEIPTLSESALQLVREASAGCDFPESHNALVDRVTNCGSEGKHEEAISLCQEAIAKMERTTGHFHPEVAVLQNILAIVYRDQKKYEESENSLRLALDIRKKTLGAGHPAVEVSLNNLAAVCEKQGKLEDAENLSQKALKLCERRLEKSPVDVVRQLNALATLYLNHGKFEDAAAHFQRAFDISSSKLTSDLGFVTKLMINLANCNLKMENFKKAESLFREVLSKASKQKQVELEEKAVAGLLRSMKIDTCTIDEAVKTLDLIFKRQGKLELQQQPDLRSRTIRRAHSVSRCVGSPRQPLRNINNLDIDDKIRRRYSLSPKNNNQMSYAATRRKNVLLPVKQMTKPSVSSPHLDISPVRLAAAFKDTIYNALGIESSEIKKVV